MHGRQVPDVTDQRPARHDVEEMGHHAMFTTVPECIPEPHVILKKKRNQTQYVKQQLQTLCIKAILFADVQTCRKEIKVNFSNSSCKFCARMMLENVQT